MFKNKTLVIRTLVILSIVTLASIKFSRTSDMANAQIEVASFDNDVVQAIASSVYFIFPDNDATHSKPPGVFSALVSDWSALGFVYAMCTNMPQNTAPDTRTSLFSSQDGSPILSSSQLVLFGGPLVNAPVHYYETNRIAPLYYQNDGGTLYWYRADGTRIDATALLGSQKSSHDMFVVESFTDDNGNHIFIVYGYGWKGTFAGGKFFKFVMYPNISSYTASYYVFEWTDSNGDGFVDLNEISTTPVAQG
jgi:hypothetical protein